MAIAVARYLQDGRLDSTFGVGGIVRTNFPGRVEKVVEVSVGPQDRIVVIASDGDNLLIASYLADGRLNNEFSQDGKVRLPFPFRLQDATVDSFDQVIAGMVTAVPDGAIGSPPVQGARIVGVGETFPPADRFTLARYHPFDRLDQTFGSGGFVITDFLQEGNARALSVHVDRQHRIAAAGSVRSFDDNQTHFAVARYLPNGLLDSSFGGDGRVVTRFQEGSSEAVAVAGIGGQGRIVLAGHVLARHINSAIRSFALARYLENGTLDTGFGGDGRVVTSFQEGNSLAAAVTADGRGRIVAAGFAGSRFALARYLTNGNLDTSFSSDGRATTDIPGSSNSSINALFVSASDETITAVGVASGEFAVARFRDDGRLDPAFSFDGRVRTVIGSGNEGSAAQAVAADSQRRLIVAGVVEAAVE